MTILWRGWHSPDLQAALKATWFANDLLVLCPYHLHDFSFLRALPESRVVFAGDWDQTTKARALEFQPKGNSAQFAEQPVIAIFTSGSMSGTPRLVLYSKRNILCSLDGVRSFFDTSRIKKIFCYPQPLHTFGFSLGYVHAMLKGLELVAASGRYSSAAHDLWFSSVDENTLTLGVPTHFSDLIKVADRRNVPNSYSCIIGGAPVSVALWHQARSILKIEAPSIGYGATECAPGVTHLGAGVAPTENGEIGIALPGVEFTKVNEGVRVKGDNVCVAQYDGEKLTFGREAILSDSVKLKSGGGWVYQGRTDHLINRGGLKFQLETIEDFLDKKHGVRAVCVAVKDERLGDDLAIVAEPTKVAVQQIYRDLESHFHTRFDSKKFYTLAALPVNASNKIDRRECQKALENSEQVLI